MSSAWFLKGESRHQEGAVEPLFGNFGAMLLAIVEQLLMRTRFNGPIGSMEQLVAFQPHHVLGIDPELVRHGPIDFYNVVLRVNDGHQVGNRIEGAFPVVVGPPERYQGFIQLSGDLQKGIGQFADFVITPDICQFPGDFLRFRAFFRA